MSISKCVFSLQEDSHKLKVMLQYRKNKPVQRIKHPEESVWYGIEPLLQFSKVLGCWPCVTFKRTQSVQKNRQNNHTYFCILLAWKDWLVFTIQLVLSLYMAVLVVIGEGNYEYQNTSLKRLSYVNIIANNVLHTLPRLLTVAAIPKLVQFLNKIACLDYQLQIHPDDCLTLRRKSWMLLTWIVLVAVIHFGLSSVNFQWWRKAGQSDIAGILGVILPPIHVVSSSTIILVFVQLLDTLEHRFQVITSQAVELLESAGNNTIHVKHPTVLIESSPPSAESLASKLKAVRQNHDFLQDSLDLLCTLSGILVGCIIPLQVFLIITDSSAIVRKISIWIGENRISHLFSVILRVLCWATDIVAIFWAADKMKSRMVSISRAIQKYSLLGLCPEEQFQVQLLSSQANRCKTDIRPAGFFALSCSVIPALIANFTTFFIVQYQTYTEDGSESTCKNLTALSVN